MHYVAVDYHKRYSYLVVKGQGGKSGAKGHSE